MVVHDLDVLGICARPVKADSELIVHTDAPLAHPITFEPLKSICRRSPQIIDAPSQVELFEFAQSGAFDIRKSSDAPKPVQGLGVGTSK